MKRIIYPLILLSLLLSGCAPEPEMVSLGVEETYAIYRMKMLKLHPEFRGDGGYRWWSGDSLVSDKRDFYFVAPEPGKYQFRLEILDSTDPVTRDFTVNVWEEEVAYSPYIDDVKEYRPAPGQFIGVLPPYKPGDTEKSMTAKAAECIRDRNDVMVSLGGFGGYITFSFDHTVVNVPGEYDFKIHGNAFYASANPNPNAPESGGSAEPGIVMVAIDENQNGLPDDPWYELAGSEYGNPATIHNYEICYRRPAVDHKPTPIDGTAIVDSTYIPYTDNQGVSGYMAKNSYHAQEYYPPWIEEDEMVFRGTCLPPNARDESGTGTFYVLYAYDWGYVDNHPNEIPGKSCFDIGWAVDAEGNPVHLPGIDFVRVYTGVNQQCGWLGETSTEICRAEDLHIK